MTMLPIHINDLSSQIKLDDMQQPCFSLALSLQLPLAAIVETLLDFQAKHSGLSAKAKPWAPGQGPLQTPPGPPPRGPLRPPPPSRRPPPPPGSRPLDDPPIRPREKHTPRRRDGIFTYDTPIAELHDRYDDYIERTTWKARPGDWELHDETSLLDFKPVVLAPPVLGRGQGPRREEAPRPAAYREVSNKVVVTDEMFMAKLRQLAVADSPALANAEADSPAVDNVEVDSPAVDNAEADSPAGDNVEADSPAVDNASAAEKEKTPEKLPGRGSCKREECKQQ